MLVEKIFLTDRVHEDSAISWYVGNKTGGDGWQGVNHIESEIKVSDCNRTITIDMDCSAKNCEHKRKKIRTLINSLIKYENALLAEMNRVIPETEKEIENE